MSYYTFNFDNKIPELVVGKTLPDYKNSWVDPSGNFYGFEGAKHLITATYLCVIKLGINPDDLKKGTFFNEQFDSRLLSLGWLEIKDVSWLGSTSKPKFQYKYELTQAQQNIVFDYCEKHNLDFKEIII